MLCIRVHLFIHSFIYLYLLLHMCTCVAFKKNKFSKNPHVLTIWYRFVKKKYLHFEHQEKLSESVGIYLGFVFFISKDTIFFIYPQVQQIWKCWEKSWGFKWVSLEKLKNYEIADQDLKHFTNTFNITLPHLYFYLYPFHSFRSYLRCMSENWFLPIKYFLT